MNTISVPLDNVATYPLLKTMVDSLIEEAQTQSPMNAQTAINLLERHLPINVGQKFPELNGCRGEITIHHTSARQVPIPHFAVTGKVNGQLALQFVIKYYPDYGWDCAESSHRGEGTFESPKFINM